jgi:hypothetical protein
LIIVKTAKMTVFFAVIFLACQAALTAWPDASAPVQATLTFFAWLSAAGAAGLILWAIYRFLSRNLADIFAEAQGDEAALAEARQKQSTTLEARSKALQAAAYRQAAPAAVAGQVKAATANRNDAQAQITELAGIVDKFFGQAMQLAHQVASLRQTRADVAAGKLSQEAIGAVAAQDPALATVLAHPESWDDSIRVALTGAVDREIGFLVETGQQYRQRGNELLAQWQGLRAVVTGVDYFLADAESIRVLEGVQTHLLACFSAFDRIADIHHAVQSAAQPALSSGGQKWRVPALPRYSETPPAIEAGQPANRLPLGLDAVVNFVRPTPEAVTAPPEISETTGRSWARKAD